MLTAEGAVKAQQSLWDEENLCATSNLDIVLDAIDLESTNKSWLPTLQDGILEFNTSQIEMQNKVHESATDTDSISTFAPKNQKVIKADSKKEENKNSQHNAEMRITIDRNETPDCYEDL